ncbi:MAG: hypothetical protein H6766_02665 [Candidatus Peribacteria bacterium]|nr:MAG: hypothetical protein H6766_02665 [Candidatus Peribacteria bacterium]
MVYSVTHGWLEDQAIPQSYERGEHYYFSDAVYNMMVIDDTIYASVLGSDTYTVQIDPTGEGSCTCPYDW